MVRDGGRHGQSDARAAQLPAFQRLLHLRHAALVGRHAIALDVLAQARRQSLHQAWNGLEEAGVRHHRRQHRAHADVGIGLADRLQALGRRHGKFRREIVGRGTSLQHHLGRTDHAREIFVLERAMAAHPRTGRQKEFQRQPVAHALGQIAVAVRLAVDQAGMQQAPLGVDERVALDQDVGMGRGMALDVDHAAAPDHSRRHLGHVGSPSW